MDERLDKQEKRNPNMRMWPNLATSTPNNFRNNVPFDRMKRPRDHVENAVVIAGTKDFHSTKLHQGTEHDRVALAHLPVCHTSGRMLMSVDIGVTNGVDVRPTSKNTSRSSPPNEAVSPSSAGTQSSA